MVVENERYKIECNQDGFIIIYNKNKDEKTCLKLFSDKFQYLYEQWCVEPRLYLTRESKYLIVTYGIGYVYIVDLYTMKTVGEFKLFSEISYEDDSYQEIDTGCYYNEATEVDFSPSGKYVIIRVRGDYDPQEGDRRKILFTPIYFSSVFVLNIHTMQIEFQYDGSDMQEEGYNKNMAVIAMDPSENNLLVGALGNDLKLFDINTGHEIQTFKGLAWRADPCDIRKCQLALFLDDDNFAYVNKEYNIEIYTRKNDKEWVCAYEIITSDEKEGNGSRGVRKIYRLEYDKLTDEFICNTNLRYKR